MCTKITMDSSVFQFPVHLFQKDKTFQSKSVKNVGNITVLFCSPMHASKSTLFFGAVVVIAFALLLLAHQCQSQSYFSVAKVYYDQYPKTFHLRAIVLNVNFFVLNVLCIFL